MPHVLAPRALLAVALCTVAGLSFSASRSLADGDTSGDRNTVSTDWIYEDLDAAYAKAQESGKPLLVAFR